MSSTVAKQIQFGTISQLSGVLGYSPKSTNILKVIRRSLWRSTTETLRSICESS
jgi:hypothetical protein